MKNTFKLCALAAVLGSAACHSAVQKEETITRVDTIMVPSQDPPYDPVMTLEQVTIYKHADGKNDTLRKTISSSYKEAENDTIIVKSEKTGKDTTIIVSRNKK